MRVPVGCFEPKPQVLIGPEDDLVGADLEGEGEAFEGLQGGLGAGGLVAVDLDQGETGALGQGLYA
ncbi:MAG TPA: hypothetical protein VGA37_10520 [Gemmatimonadales bacterium]